MFALAFHALLSIARGGRLRRRGGPVGYRAMATHQKALAKVILLTKDEPELIGDFLEYYAALFGQHNIVVVDNGSSDPRVAAEYARFPDVQVRTDARPFPSALEWMSEHMASLRDECEWILPLETDEFLFVVPRADDRDYKLTSGDVHRYLASLDDDVSVLRYGAFLGSAVDPGDGVYVPGVGYKRPPRDVTRFYDQGWDKIIVRASTFVRMSQWCHHAVASSGRRVVSDFLGLLHFHETGFRRQVASALKVVRSFNYLDLDAPPQRQLARILQLQALGVSCGHKLLYYGTALRRRLTLEAFRRVAGRLPCSAREMERYASKDDPDAAVAADAVALRASPASLLSWNELMYHEEPRACQHHVRHVANFFLSSFPHPPPTKL